MTEIEARERICKIISNWVGGKRGGSQHYEILNIYNSHTPLPRGYAVKPTDAYCATTVSAAAILAGYEGYIPIECSCNNMIQLAQQMGIWVEYDGYEPKIGDIIMYDWQDSGSGDNQGSADHVGIVTNVRGERFTVTEGNIGGNIGTREWYVNRPKTRGYITPNYGAIAYEFTKKEEEANSLPQGDDTELTGLGEGETDEMDEYIHTVADAPAWARDELQRLVDRGALRGDSTGDLNLSEDMLRVLIICQRMVDEK